MNLLYDKLDNKYCLWAASSSNAVDDVVDVMLEGYYKLKHGVKYFFNWQTKFDLDLLRKEIKENGEFSKRPFRLGQTYDKSVGACIFALYYDFCSNYYLDPRGMLFKAYGDKYFLNYDFAGTKKVANWQGVIYPEKWSSNEAYLLMESLKNMGMSELVTEIEKNI